MEKEIFLKLLSRKLLGEISDAESAALKLEMENNEAYQQIAEELSHNFTNKQNVNVDDFHLAKIWEKIEHAEREGLDGKFDYSTPIASKVKQRNLLKVAAVLLCVVGISLLGYKMLDYFSGNRFNTVATSKEKTFKLMEDGTKIWLNKESSISYNSNFGKDKREIFLEGEAYFDVAKSKTIPLFIHARNIDIEVKGTAFNVNAYKEKDQIQVVLVRGAIQVTDRLNKKNQVLLSANQKLVFNILDKDDQDFHITPIALNLLHSDLKWTMDTLRFNKEKLRNLALRMEKKYDVKIEIKSEQLREKRFSGVFVNETIQQALEALKLSYPLTFTISNRTVVIKD